MNPDLNLPEITRLLLLPPSQRTTLDADLLVRLTTPLKFFRDQPPHIHIACCQVMKVAYFQQGEVVFHIGDQGDSFCVMLKGTVEILVPGYRLQGLVKTDGKKHGNEDDLVQVATLEAGAAFGELALLNNQTRAATVKARTCIALAVLYKEEYNRILRAEHDGQLKDKVKFLRSFPMFSEWTQQALSKATYYFKELLFMKGEILFKEGEEVTNVLFIKEGEFQVRDMQLFKKILAPQDSEVRHASGMLFSKAMRNARPRPVLIKSGREILGLDEAFSGLPHPYSCVCLSDLGVVWAISKEVYVKARFDVEQTLLTSHLGVLARAENLRKSFDGSRFVMPTDKITERSSPQKRAVSTMKQRLVPSKQMSDSLTIYENVFLDPHKVISSRFVQHVRSASNIVRNYSSPIRPSASSRLRGLVRLTRT